MTDNEVRQAAQDYAVEFTRSMNLRIERRIKMLGITTPMQSEMFRLRFIGTLLYSFSHQAAKRSKLIRSHEGWLSAISHVTYLLVRDFTYPGAKH